MGRWLCLETYVRQVVGVILLVPTFIIAFVLLNKDRSGVWHEALLIYPMMFMGSLTGWLQGSLILKNPTYM
jgi:hypothetical protein